MISDELKACYRYHQKTQRFGVPVSVQDWGGRARFSLIMARQDAAAGTERYLPAPGDYGPKFAAHGESHMRWMENPLAAGLRLVGYADELSPHVSHTGWYTDQEYSEGCARGVVYRLPTHKGKELFVYGYADNENPPSACLCFDVTRGEAGHPRGAAHWADEIARLVAEQESEYQEAWRAGRAYDEAGEEVGGIRRTTLALIKEIKTVLIGAPNICATLRAVITSNLQEISTLRERRAELFATYGTHPGWVDT